MRQVTQQTVKAFINRKRRTVGNTHTDGNSLFLHGNLIAQHDGYKVILSDAGWRTNTTKERLNGILDFFSLPRIYQKNFTWYQNGVEWTGTLTIDPIQERNKALGL